MENNYEIDFQKMKDRLFFTVCNEETNREKLKTLPHVEIQQELAITFHFDVGNGYYIPVDNEMMVRMGMTPAKLWKQAQISAPRVRPAKEFSLQKMLAQNNIQSDEPRNMIILSTADQIKGAGVVFYPNLLWELAARMGETELYLIPSSVHEMLALPVSEIPYEGIEEMIREINRTLVVPRDRLSDHVYVYEKSDDSLVRADLKKDWPERKEADLNG